VARNREAGGVGDYPRNTPIAGRAQSLGSGGAAERGAAADEARLHHARGGLRS